MKRFARTLVHISVAVVSVVSGAQSVVAQNLASCRDLPTHAELRAALVKARNESNGGFNLHMWGTVVNRDGEGCAVAFTGGDRGDQWPGSRVISAQKGEYRECIQPTGIGSLNGQSLYRRPTGRKPVWPAA